MQNPTDDPAARLLEALGAMDLTSADGRAGIHTLLAEIERAAPDAILRRAAGIDLRRLGWPPARAAAPGSALGAAPATDAPAPRA